MDSPVKIAVIIYGVVELPEMNAPINAFPMRTVLIRSIMHRFYLFRYYQPISHPNSFRSLRVFL
jgi:hypothetical protein